MKSAEHSYYDQLASILILAGIDISVSEIHGIMCGAICNWMKTGREPQPMALLLPGSEDSPEQMNHVRAPLEELFRTTLQDLQQRRPKFDLLLPAQEQSLAVRGAALSEWCQGFLLGLLYDRTLAIDELPGDAREIARDMLRISEMEEITEDQGGDEWDLAQVEEYVRMGVQLIVAELEDTTGDAQGSSALRH